MLEHKADSMLSDRLSAAVEFTTAKFNLGKLSLIIH
jgi:hypothetical protein